MPEGTGYSLFPLDRRATLPIANRSLARFLDTRLIISGRRKQRPSPGEQSYILNVQEAGRTADLKMPNRGPNMRTALWGT